jgi:O-acetyl-ADP-ribose deacetylase (regulator of RNase III)
LLASCYRTCFRIARENGIRTIAFPAISCGAYGYPIPEAAAIAIRETRAALSADAQIKRVLFACFTEEVFAAYAQALESNPAESV